MSRIAVLNRCLMLVCAGLLLVAPAAGAAPAAAPTQNDERAGYYYPAPKSSEVYTSRARQMPDAKRASRLAFVTGLTQQQFSQSYAPTFAMFAKGGDAERLIIISLGDHGFHTLYQARALLAQLTAVARSSTLLKELAVEDMFTFFDFARLLGFRRIVVSDGASFAHEIVLR